MSRVASFVRRVFSWVRRHAVTGLNVALSAVVALLVLLVGSGLWLTPTAAPAPAPPTTTTTTVPPSAALDTSPATGVVTSVMNQLRNVTGFTSSIPTYSTTDPLLAGCASAIIPVAQMGRSLTLSSASIEVVVDVDVYGAGLGDRVLARTLRSTSACSGDYVQSSTLYGFDGFMASSTDVSGSYILEVTARVGDVVFSLYGFPTGYQSATSATLALATLVLNALSPAMTSVCVDEHAGAAVAQRNPTQRDYKPYSLTTVISPPPSVPRPNLALLYGALPVVATPAPGSITSAPAPPVVPTVALSATVAVPQPDPIGPGCGWAFTAMVPPAFSPTTDQQAIAQADAITQLENAWTNWPHTVNAYLAAKAVYLADLASFEATIPSTTTTTTAPPVPTTTTTSATPTTTTTAPPNFRSP